MPNARPGAGRAVKRRQTAPQEAAPTDRAVGRGRRAAVTGDERACPVAATPRSSTRQRRRPQRFEAEVNDSDAASLPGDAPAGVLSGDSPDVSLPSPVVPLPAVDDLHQQIASLVSFSNWRPSATPL